MLEYQEKLYNEIHDEVPESAEIIRAMINISKKRKNPRSEKKYQKMLETVKPSYRPEFEQFGNIKVQTSDSRLSELIKNKSAPLDFDTWFERVTNLHIDDGVEHLVLAKQFLEDGHKVAAQICGRIAFKSTEDSLTPFLYEMCEDPFGDSEVNFLVVLWEVLPTETDIIFHLTWAYILRKKGLEAALLAHKLYKLNPKDLRSIFTYGVASLSSGDINSAENLWNQIPEKKDEFAQNLAFLIIAVKDGKNLPHEIEKHIDISGQEILWR